MLLSRGDPPSSLKPIGTNLNGLDQGPIAHLFSRSGEHSDFLPAMTKLAARFGHPHRLVRFTAVDYPPPRFHDRKRGRPLALTEGSGRNSLQSSVSLHPHDRP